LTGFFVSEAGEWGYTGREVEGIHPLAPTVGAYQHTLQYRKLKL